MLGLKEYVMPASDRAAAENILSDLKDAIGQKEWYSQTKPPKPQ